MFKQGMDELDRWQTQGILKHNSSCIHTRSIKNLVSLEDLGENKLLSSHVVHCKVCTHALKEQSLRIEQLKILVPRPQIDLQSKENFESEVSEIFKSLKKNEKQLLKGKIKQNLKNVDSAFLDFFKNLLSKKMMKAYVLAAVVFVVLRQIL